MSSAAELQEQWPKKNGGRPPQIVLFLGSGCDLTQIQGAEQVMYEICSS